MPMAGHIGIQALAMLLLFLLDVVEHIPYVGVSEFEYRRIVCSRHIFLGGEQVFAHHGVGLRRRTAGLYGRERLAALLALLTLLAACGGQLATEQLVERIQMLLFLLALGRKQLLKLGIGCLVGITAIFFDAQLFMLFLILQAATFLSG